MLHILPILCFLSYQLSNTVPISDAHFVNTAFKMGLEVNFKQFPKFARLMTYLKENFAEKESFHGIVFVETRSGVSHLARMMKNDPDMKNVDFVEYVGHGCKKPAAVLADDDIAQKGINGREQERQLQRFKEQGKKILVATHAAGEGLDMQDCEFVIRYSIAKTGQQLVQSKGRSRKWEGVFVHLILKGSLDVRMYEKSKKEEANMRFGMDRIGAIMI